MVGRRNARSMEIKNELAQLIRCQTAVTEVIAVNGDLCALIGCQVHLDGAVVARCATLVSGMNSG